MDESRHEIGRLRRRWTPEQLQEIGIALQSGTYRQICTQLNDVAGKQYIDLRGTTIAQFLNNCSLSNIDLSYSRFLEGIGGVLHSNLHCCRLRAADFTKVCVLAVNCSDCDLSRT